MAAVACPRCGEQNEASALICLSCGANLSRARYGARAASNPAEPAPEPESPAAAAEIVCQHCGTTSAATQPVCGSCLRPFANGCGVVLVDADGRRMQVPAGGTLVLGRDPSSPVAHLFAESDVISRRHATLGSHDDGTVWVRDEGSTNGTFVNDRPAPAGEMVALAEGDALRLASTARFTVRTSPTVTRVPRLAVE